MSSLSSCIHFPMAFNALSTSSQVSSKNNKKEIKSDGRNFFLLHPTFFTPPSFTFVLYNPVFKKIFQKSIKQSKNDIYKNEGEKS